MKEKEYDTQQPTGHLSIFNVDVIHWFESSISYKAFIFKLYKMSTSVYRESVNVRGGAVGQLVPGLGKGRGVRVPPSQLETVYFMPLTCHKI